MKSLSVLKKESEKIKGNIRVMLLDKPRFDDNSNKQNIASDINSLQNKLAVVQRELRERLIA
jgi:hypothetical protein